MPPQRMELSFNSFFRCPKGVHWMLKHHELP
jgi:hypothetical protein